MQKKSFMSVKFRSTVLKLISSVIDKGLFLRGIDVNSYGAWTGQGDESTVLPDSEADVRRSSEFTG